MSACSRRRLLIGLSAAIGSRAIPAIASPAGRATCLALDCPDRMRVPAGQSLTITGITPRRGSVRGWLKHVDAYVLGGLDINGAPLANTLICSHSCTHVRLTQETKQTRMVDAGTFFTHGYEFVLDNNTPPPQDRCVRVWMVGTPVCGYAQRTKTITLLLEGSRRLSPDGKAAPWRDVYVGGPTRHGGNEIAGT